LLYGQKHDFNKAVEKVSEYVQKFTGAKHNFSDTSNEVNLWASTVVTHSSISTQVIVCQPRNQADPDLVLSSGTVKLPTENLVAFYRQLLVWNNLATDIAHFAVNDQQDIVALVYRRPIEGLDYSEFKDALETISTVNMNSIVLLKRDFHV
jgi:hypothetical protein